MFKEKKGRGQGTLKNVKEINHGETFTWLYGIKHKQAVMRQGKMLKIEAD